MKTHRSNGSALLISMICLTLAVVLTACGQGFSNKNLVNGGNGGGNSGQGDGNVDPQTQWQNLKTEIDSSVSSGEYTGKLVVSLDSENQMLNLHLPIPSEIFSVVPTFSIPQLPGAEIRADAASDTWVLSIPLKYVLRGASLGAVNKLPNGDTIPYIPAGEIKGVSISLPQKPNYRVHIYLTISAAAVFIETPDWELPDWWFNPGFVVKSHTPIPRQIGYFQIVKQKQSSPSGVYLAAKLPRDVAILLDQLVKF